MNEERLLNEPVGKLYCRYLIPSVCATLVTSIYVLADTVMIGWGVGHAGIAALNILLPVYNLFFGTGLLCGVGGSVLFSVSMGRGEKEAAKRYFSCSMAMAGIFSLLYGSLLQIFFEPFTAFLGNHGELDCYVREYGRLLVGGAPLFLFSSCLQTFVRNDRAPKRAMAAVVTGGVLNVILDYLFIFPMGLGMGGAMLATLAANSVTILILASRFFSPDSDLRFRAGIRLREILKVAENGFSSFLLEFSGGIVIFLFNKQLLSYAGEPGVVAYGIISNCAIVVSSVGNGVAQAVQPIAAVNFGCGNRERVKQVRSLGLAAAFLSGLLFMSAGIFEPARLIRAFTEPTEEILRLGIPGIRLYFISFAAAGANILLITYFQSVLRPAWALLLSVLRGLLFNCLFVMVLPLFLGTNGIWSAMIFTEFLTLLAGLFLLRREKDGKNAERD